ncbi:MAG: type II toxin-antitoxin system HicB family antitoxin [Solirubrobacterales bacterium]|nr:type II toxin-antitoxin system HicB family antitoxin [Solirubrobacterales bacterium]MBV9473710.1 type II toxin-antitoxin system HicB family antitoxin [Solirubrobacterales bacterium]MBV9838138.1 type II toxin-antitoxin system HicB family antitoxin [Solirubrobacterales bacterium]
MELTVVVHQERQGFWSEIEELPGCFASGRTLVELREALAEAVGMYFSGPPVDLDRQPIQQGRLTLRVSDPPA